MNTKLLLVLGILLGVLAVALMWPPRPNVATDAADRDGELLSSRRFVLEKDGARLLDESSSIFLTPGGTKLLISRSTLTIPGASITIAAQTQYDLECRPIAYQLAAETPGGAQIVSARKDGAMLRMEARAGTARQAVDLPNARDAILLDNNVIAHYVVLFDAIRLGIVSQTFSAAVPQALAGIPARWESASPLRFRSGDATYDAKKTTIHLGDVAIDLVSVEGKLVGLVNRTQGTVAYDVDLLPNGMTVLGEPTSAVTDIVEKDVSFESAGVTLSGTLALPGAQTPTQRVVLIVAGSGPVDRDGNAPGFRMDGYRQLAQTLARGGIASFRYDKRGVGRSKGTTSLASRADLLTDLRAAWSALAIVPEVNGLPRYALGHSEGAYLVADLAAENPDVAGLILLCGSPQSLADVTRWQVETLLRLQGATDEQVRASLEQEDAYLSFVKSSSGQWSDYTVAQLREALPWLSDAAAAQLKASPLGLAWLREHYNANPAEVLARVACPVLVLSAGKDLQVPPADGEAAAQILRKAGNTAVTAVTIPDLNHVLRRHPEEPSLLYQHLDAPIDERIAQAIVEWIEQERGD